MTRWLADEPVLAWREPWRVRGLRWVKRHRTTVAATAAACAAALFLGGIGLYSYQGQVRREISVAEAALARAEQIQSDARTAWTQRLDATAWLRVEALASDAADRDSAWLPAGLRRRLRDLAAGVKAEANATRADAALLRELAAIRAARNDPFSNASSRYGIAFQKRGLAVEAADPAVPRSWPRPVAVEVAAYLDDWALLVKDKKGTRDQVDRITALARRLDPDPWRNALRDALSLLDRPERKRAVLCLAAAPDVATQPSPTIALLAASLREAGEPGEAIRLLEPARFSHPDVWIYQELGLSLREARPPRREAALRAFTAATTLRPEMGFELAKELRGAGQTVEAISVLEEVTRRQPEAINFYWLGLWMYEVGRTTECTKMFQRAVALSQSRLKSGIDDFETHRTLGMCLTRVEKFSAAIDELRLAIGLNPDSADAHNNLALALLLSQQVTAAAAEWRESVRLEPQSAAYRVNLGIALYRLGDLAGATAEARQAIRLKPDLAAGHDALGFFLSEANDWVGAVAAFREAIRFKPDSPQARSNLGHALGKSGDPVGGVAELREAIRLNPSYFPAHDNLGDLLVATGDRLGAVAAFREVIRLNPGDPDAPRKLARVLGDLGRPQEALALMEHGQKPGERIPQQKEPSAALIKQRRSEGEPRVSSPGPSPAKPIRPSPRAATKEGA